MAGSVMLLTKTATDIGKNLADIVHSKTGKDLSERWWWWKEGRVIR